MIIKDVNLFETTIRVLGGLLSTYHLSKEKIYLDKAVDLAGIQSHEHQLYYHHHHHRHHHHNHHHHHHIFFPDRLLTAFDTPSGIPFSDVNLKTRRGHAPKWSPDSSTSEVMMIFVMM